MEKLEREILGILETDCRSDARKIAVMLGEDEARVAETVRSMERRGVIVKYTAVFNLEEEEDERVQALIEVKVTPQTGSGFDGIAGEISRHEEVKSLYLMSGAYDFAVIVESASVRGVAKFISECISTFECVTSTATHFILKKYKIEGAIAGGKRAERLPVQP